MLWKRHVLPCQISAAFQPVILSGNPCASSRYIASYLTLKNQIANSFSSQAFTYVPQFSTPTVPQFPVASKACTGAATSIIMKNAIPKRMVLSIAE